MGKALGLSTGTLTKEMRLLLAFLAEDHNPNDLPVSQPELFRETDWEIFIELARHHRVYPYLYRQLKHMSEAWVPAWVVRKMSTAASRMNAPVWGEAGASAPTSKTR